MRSKIARMRRTGMIAVLMLQASLQAQEMPGTQEMPRHQHQQMSMQMDGALGRDRGCSRSAVRAIEIPFEAMH